MLIEIVSAIEERKEGKCVCEAVNIKEDGKKSKYVDDELPSYCCGCEECKENKELLSISFRCCRLILVKAIR